MSFSKGRIEMMGARSWAARAYQSNIRAGIEELQKRFHQLFFVPVK